MISYLSKRKHVCIGVGLCYVGYLGLWTCYWMFLSQSVATHQTREVDPTANGLVNSSAAIIVKDKSSAVIQFERITNSSATRPSNYNSCVITHNERKVANYSTVRTEKSKLLAVSRTARQVGNPSTAGELLSKSVKLTRVAIGLAMTPKGMGKASDEQPFKHVQFFSVFMSSFCQTASRQFEYHFYVAYDNIDGFFRNRTKGMQRHYREHLDRDCAGLRVHRSIHFLKCSYSGRPAWSQNDAMMEAYLDGNDYFYRVNDDSRMESSGWTEAFVEVLRNRNPPNIGVVGPDHRESDTSILTHDFVHKTHIEIFGLYYPRCYTDPYAGTWISQVYQSKYTTKLREVRLTHHHGQGRRSKTKPKSLCRGIKTLVKQDQLVLEGYLKYKMSSPEDTSVRDVTKVIAMSLHGSQARLTFGAIRNAQLAPVLFPGWRLRIYAAGGQTDSALVTPPRILDRLKDLGAEVTYMNATSDKIPPLRWPYLIVDDTSVKYFIIRNADGRLDFRDFSAVSDWVAHGASFHFLRDKYHCSSVGEGLWGGRNPALSRLLPIAMRNLLLTTRFQRDIPGIIMSFAESDYLVHGGSRCTQHQGHCRPHLVKNKYLVGQVYDEFHRAIPPRLQREMLDKEQ